MKGKGKPQLQSRLLAGACFLLAAGGMAAAAWAEPRWGTLGTTAAAIAALTLLGGGMAAACRNGKIMHRLKNPDLGTGANPRNPRNPRTGDSP